VEGQALSQELSQRSVAAAKIITLDPAMPDSELDAAAQKAAACQQTVVMAFTSVSAYKGDLALPGGFPKLVDAVIANGPVTLVSLGSPYLIRNFPKAAAYMTTYSPVSTSEIAAVKALFGEIDINGHLPVTIPGIAEFGFGISVPRRTR
jgi:beta-N-acetylhexosaminidase